MVACTTILEFSSWVHSHLHSNFRGIQHLWPQGTPAHMCTYSHKHNFKIIELNLLKLRLMWYL